MTSNRLLPRIAILAATALLAACGADDTERGPEPDTVPRTGDLRILNAIVDSPDLLAFRSGTSVGTVPFSTVVSLDNSIVANYRIDIGFLDAQNTFVPIVNDMEVPIYEDYERTVMVTGTLANAAVTVIANEEFLYGERGTPVLDPQIQFVHAADGIGSLDFHLTAPAAAITTPSATLDLRAYSPISSTAAGDYQLRVTPAGQPGTVLFDSGTFARTSTTRETYVAVNYVGPGGPGIRVIRITALGFAESFPAEVLSAAVRFANLVADLPLADLYFGDPATTAAIFEDVAFGEFSPYLTLAGGNQTVRVTAADVTSPVIHTQAIGVLSGNFATYNLGGLVNPASIVGNYVLDDNRIVGTRTQVRFFNASPAAGVVNVYLLVPGQTTTDVLPTFLSAPVGGAGVARLPPGPYDLVVENAQGVNLSGPERVDIPSDDTQMLTITDTVGGGAPFVVNLATNP